MFARELIPVQVFFVLLACLAYLELRLLAHFVLYFRTRPRPPYWTRLGAAAGRRLTLLIHSLAAAGFLCLPYGFLVEPQWLQANTVRLSSPKIPASAGTVRLLQLSDLHADNFELNLKAAAEAAAGLKPDLVAVTGDYANTPEGAPAARRLLSSLKAPYGVYCVDGNYDLAVPVPGLLDGLPVKRLAAGAAVVDVRGAKLRLLGFDVGKGPLLRRTMAALGKSPGYDILLHHYSDLAYEAQKAGVDLYLSGHTHGGQVRVPFYGALITLATFGKRFESGLYRLGAMDLYVSRGLGLEGGRAPRVRFLCRPELTLFEISGK